MAQADDGGARRREPLVLGITGALIGVVLAVALVAFLGLSGTGPGASGSPAALSSASVAPSLAAAGSPSIAPTAAPPPSAEVTIAPATVAPTAVPTPRPTRTPRPTATPNTNPTIATWEVPQLEDCTGATAGQIEVSWVVRRATGVTISIDGPGIFDSYARTSDSITLPFGCAFEAQHTYTLRTTGGSGPAATSTKTVKVRPPSVVSFSMGADGVANCPNDNAIVGIDLAFEVRAATGAELRRDGALYSTYSQKVVNTSGIMYDCSKEQQVFKLTTTGGYGDPASKSITVTRGAP